MDLSLPSTTAIEVCKYIRNNISAKTIYQNGYSFNAVVNGADFFSGTMYSDGGSTWWGIVQQRGGSIDGNTIYKYLYIGGADSVTPFNSSSIRCYATITDANQYGDKRFNVYVVVDGKTTNLGGATIVADNPYGFGQTFDKSF